MRCNMELTGICRLIRLGDTEYFNVTILEEVIDGLPTLVIGNGWNSFYRAHDIQLTDWIMFDVDILRSCDHSPVFVVTVFDSSGCVK